MTATKQKYSDLVQALFDRDTDRAQELIMQGANPNEAGPAYNQGGTILHLALLYGDNKIIELLVEKRADINALNKDGQTPLMCAICHDNTWAVAFLSEKGAALSIRCHKGYTAHDYAKYNNRSEALILLAAAIERERQREEKQAAAAAEQHRLGAFHDTAFIRQAALKNRRHKVMLKP